MSDHTKPADPLVGTVFEGAPIIHAYTVEQALDDGDLVDARLGDLAEVTQQHHPNPIPVYLTRSLFRLMEKAVNHPRQCNDWRGVWHDVLGMSRHCLVPLLKRQGGTAAFEVIITGTGRRRLHRLLVGLSGDGWTYMPPEDA